MLVKAREKIGTEGPKSLYKGQGGWVLIFSYSRDFVWTMHKAKEDWESSS